MKKLLMGIAAVIVAMPLVAGASATDKPASKDATKKSDARPAFKPDANVRESSDIIGTRVKDAQGKNIGEIDRLLIDESGKVTHAVVGVGGVLGVGEDKVVVPWSEVKMTAAKDGGRKAEITMDQAKLQNAPRYERMAGDRAPAASPATTRDADKDRKRNSTDKAPSDPTKK